MGAREEVLTACQALATESPDGTFHLNDVLAEMHPRGTRYKPSTIRTHVTSRMCVDAPEHHVTRYGDLRRVGDGRYRLAT